MAKREQVRARTGVPLRWYFLAIVAVAVFAHGLSLGSDFYMDDKEHILKQERIVEGQWYEFSWRWIPYMAFCVVYRIFGYSSVAFHALNLVLHVGVSCLLFVAGRDIFGYLKFLATPAQRRRAAFLGAMLFAAHPLCSEVVNYARCTMIGSVTLFSVLATWAAVRFFEVQGRAAPVSPVESEARRRMTRQWAIVTCAGVLLAAASKNPGIFHALGNVILVGLAMAGVAQLRHFWHWTPTKRQWLFLVPGILLVGVLSYIWSHEIQGAILRWEHVYLVHTLTQGRVFWEYVERIFWPMHLASDHYIAWSAGFGDTVAILKTAGLFGLSIGAFAGMFFHRTRVACLLLCLALAPFLLRFLYPVKELMVEYRAYPAMPWIALLGGAGLTILVEHRRTLGIGIAAAIITACAAHSVYRSMDWQDVETLALNVLEQYPLNGRAVTHLQAEAFAKGDFAMAVGWKREMEELTAKNIAFNEEHARWRVYEQNRFHENYCNAEQIVVYALAEWKGDEAALGYADQRLEDLARKLPRYYLDLRKGGYRKENTLVIARNRVAARVDGR